MVDSDLNNEIDFLQTGFTPIILEQPKKNMIISSEGLDLELIIERSQHLSIQWEYLSNQQEQIWNSIQESDLFNGVKTERLKVNRLPNGVEKMIIREKYLILHLFADLLFFQMSSLYLIHPYFYLMRSLLTMTGKMMSG